MTTQSMNLPFNIPWTQIAVSPDMMDEQFCNKTFPFAWRSSIAISVYEPTPAQIPGPLCGQRLTYMKVTATVTGYQPSRQETEWLKDLEDALVVQFPDIPVEDIRDTVSRIIDEYFACYGALLNVAVFPLGKTRKELVERVRIDFAKLEHTEPGTSLPNPFVHSTGIEFLASDRDNNLIVDMHPSGGDGNGELDLAESMTIKIPMTLALSAIEAKVVHFSDSGLTMEALGGSVSFGTATATQEQGVVQTLLIEGEGIEQVIFKSPNNKSLILEFTGFIGKEVPLTLAEYPHIVAMEPKQRDLYQAATETGELLTSSASTIATDKTATHTESSESGLNLAAKYTPTPDSEISGSFSHKWGSSDQDQRNIHTDDSRDRRETKGTTTQLSQMYNLLTGYHQGTNRAVHLLLARPHVLQPTDFRTFVQGLRAIEGIQEFFFVVSRPDYIPGMSIEAVLETGNFPENAEILRPEDEFQEGELDFVATAKVDGAGLLPWSDPECRDLSEFESAKHSIPAGWVVDTRPSRRRQIGDPTGSGWDEGHPGIADLDQDIEPLPDHINYQASDGAVVVSGEICGDDDYLTPGEDFTFRRRFRIFIRSEQPHPQHQQPHASLDYLLITSRGLCVSFLSGDPCPQTLPPPAHKPPYIEKIVEERRLRLSPSLLTSSMQRQTRLPAMKDFLRGVRSALSNSWRSPRRHQFGEEFSFLDSDYLKDKLVDILPAHYLDTEVQKLQGVPESIVNAFGTAIKVRDVLASDLETFRRSVGVSSKEASHLRHSLLGLRDIRPNQHNAEK